MRDAVIHSVFQSDDLANKIAQNLSLLSTTRLKMASKMPELNPGGVTVKAIDECDNVIELGENVIELDEAAYANAAYAKALCQSKKFGQLELRRPLSNDELTNLQKILSKLSVLLNEKGIRFIYRRDRRISKNKEEMKTIGMFIKEIPDIDFCLNDLVLADAQALVEGGAFRGSLTSINLSENNLGADGAKALALAIRDSNPLTSLKSINLSGNSLRAYGARMFVQGGAFKGSLTSINLKNNALGEEGARRLALAIKSSNLTSINLSGNNLCYDEIGSYNVNGIKGIAGALSVRDSPTSIDLAWNNIGAAGADALVKGGAFKGSLTSINLGANNLGPEGAQALVDGGAFRGSLTSIDLSNNFLCDVDRRGQGTYTADGITAIASALSVRGSLTSIDLRLNNLDSADKEAILANNRASLKIFA
jgi:hypothetical protein